MIKLKRHFVVEYNKMNKLLTLLACIYALNVIIDFILDLKYYAYINICTTIIFISCIIRNCKRN